MNTKEMTEKDDEYLNDFDCCADCDLPDACSDFYQCAIKAGLREAPGTW